MKNAPPGSSMQPTNLSSQKPSSAIKQEIKNEEKEIKVKQEGQKPTMETQGPPPPPTSQQYYLHPPYMPPGMGFDTTFPVYRNMLVPTAPYNTPYHLQMSRYPTPEDLSRNTKALDLLQQHAQYYNTHKIHELSERALKSPTSNVKVSVSSPNVSSQPSGSSGNSGSGGDRGSAGSGSSSSSNNVGNASGNAPSVMSQPNSGSGSSSTNLSLQQAPGSMNPNPSPGVIALNQNKNLDKGGPGSDTGSKDSSATGSGSNGGRSPPPQRHVHTHHHTHVGLGYPMYAPPYGGKIL